MWNGRKTLAGAVAAREQPVAPARRAILVGLVAALLVGGLIAATDFNASRESLRTLQTSAAE
jgi:hypothetical protein